MLTTSELIEKAQGEAGTYEIEVLPGEHIVAQNVTDSRILETIGQCSRLILASVKNGTMPEEWKPYLPITPMTATMMVMFTELIVEPKFTHTEVLELSQKGGMVAMYIMAKMTEKMQEALPSV